MEHTKNHLWLWLVATALIPSSLYVFVVAPLYIVTISDIQFSTSFIPVILRQLLYILDLARYFFSFAIIISAHYRYSNCSCGRLYLIAIAGNFYEHIANLLMDYAREGIDLSEIFWDIFVVLFYVAFESLILLILFLVWKKTMASYRKKQETLEKAARRIKGMSYETSAIFPYTKWLDLENPLQGTALWINVALAIELAMSSVFYDIMIGLPAGIGEWLETIWIYLTILLVIPIGYLCVTSIVSGICKKNQ